WVPGAAPASNTTALSAPVLATGSLASPATIQVTMVITSSTAVSGITPTALTIASTNATPPATLNASCTVSPLGPQSIAANGSLTFTWTCTNAYATGTNLGNTLGSLTFSAGATGTTPATTWNSATSNSLLITQPLTYQVTVNSGTGFNQVSNQALLSDSGAFAAGIGSNVVTTPVQQPAAVTVAKSVSPTGQVKPGTTLTYTIAVQETTANPTANVVVTDAVPAGTSYVSCATTIGTCSQSAGTVTYNLGNIGSPNGFGAATLTMTVTVNTP